MEAASRHHVAAAAAASAAASGARMSGLQLLQAQSTLAPWIERQAPLPFPLIHGPIELLRQAVQLTESPHASAKLIDDTVILLTYGASYLQDHDDESQRSLERIQAFTNQMESYRTLWKCKAQRVQATWRTQRFHTNRLPKLALETSKYLQQDVQEMIQTKTKVTQNKNETVQRQDSLKDLLSVPVEINEQELHNQVVKYAAELQRRVDARQRDADEQQRQQVKEQRAQDDKRKRLLVQKKKRYERACRTWHYFATKILRNARQQQEREDSARRLHLLTATTSGVAEEDNHVAAGAAAPSKGVDRTQSMLKVLKNPAQRQAVRRFVAKAIARGVSRVLCAYNMGTSDNVDGNASASSLSALADGNAETATSTAKVLRLGLLLCDLHFGAKYTGLYQRFFERVANERGMRVEWHVFNCLKSQFPTKAHQRVVNGFLVTGGPNIGIVNDESAVATGGCGSPQEEQADRARRRRSSGGAGSNGMRKNRHFGRWRQRLVVLLRDLYRRKQTILGGLGLGHVILAEALGGKIGMKEWEDGWSLLDATIFTAEETGLNSGVGQGQSHERRLGQSMQGVRFLHGEFVASITGVGPAKQSLRVWRSPGDHSFVSCFRDKLTLSMDGSPECGTFVFETLGEFYERDKMVRLRQSGMATKSSTRRMETRDDRDAEDDDDDDEDDFRPLVLDTSLSLEEKRKRLGITDASVTVARLFFDHFHRQIVNVSRHLNQQHASMSITGVVCSRDEMNVSRSMRQLSQDESLSAIFLNITSSSDGHLVVTNPQAFALLTDHDRRQRETQGARQQQQQQRIAAVPIGVSMVTTTRRNSLTRPQGLTLQTLRDHDRLQPSSQRSSTRLPSIRPDASSTKSLSEIVPSGSESGYRSHGPFRRTSTLASQRLVSTGEVDNLSVLTLSQALSIITKGDSKPRVFIRWSDEECKQTHDLVALNKNDLRTLWLRLIAAIRIADLPNDQIAIVSRHSLLLDFIKRKRPTWTFVKDCRRSQMTHRKRLRKVAQYAGVADVLLLDQEFLLSNSANENDALLKKAHALGLHVYVAPRDESPAVVKKQQPPDKVSSPRSSFRRVSKAGSGRRSVGGLSKEISSKTNQSGGGSGSGDAEYDMRVVEFMLLAFSGLDGVITCHPIAAADALQKIAAKSDAMQQVEQLFREWQAKDTSHKTGFSPTKRMSSSALDDGAAGDSDDPADYVAGDNQYDSDDSVPDSEIVTEMARQWAEHNQSGPAPTSFVSGGGGGGGAGGGVGGGHGAGSGPAVRGVDGAAGYDGSNVSQAPSPFVPLRPLQPRPSDQVFGIAGIRRENSARGSASGSQVRSIGSFRAAFKRTASEIPSQHAFGLTPAQPPSDGKDGDSVELRTTEGIALKPMSTRRILFIPR